jgi:hypothetical protein
MRKVFMAVTMALGMGLMGSPASIAAPADGLVIGDAARVGAVTEQVHWRGYWWRHHHRHHHHHYRYWW